MKNIFFTALFALLAYAGKAQDSTITLSKFEQVATAAGKIYRIEEKQVGTVRNQSVRVVTIKNFIDTNTLSVIRIASSFGITTPIIGNSILYIEKEDVVPIIKLLEYYSGQIKSNSLVFETYLSYITSNDIQFLCKYEQGAFSNSYLTIGKLYRHLRTPVQFSTISFNKKEIDNLIELLKDAANRI